MASYTISYKESAQGFNTFWSYQPDWMTSINNRFFSVKDGQLWEHYDEANPVRNNFYGVQYPSTLKMLINESPSEIKVVKAIDLESNKAFDLTIRSYLNDETTSITQSTIDVGEFFNKEGKWHGYTRRSEIVGDLTSKSAYGLGEAQSVATSTITMGNPLPFSIRSGDVVFDAVNTQIGVIQSYDKVNNTITVDTTPSITPGTFLFATKPERIEGSEIRGYNFEVDLVDNTTTRTELFGLGSEVFKSEPS
jgi:hypothetical protein